jgi:hypothetical protein
MRCPKCGYISFDYNQVCPKCNKNISAEQEKFFLPSFRPDPPSLLGFLTGDANESNVNLHAPTGSHLDIDHDANIDLNNDSVAIDRESLDLDEQDLEMSFEPEDSGENLFDQESVIEPRKYFSDSDFNLEEKKVNEIDSSLKTSEDEEISLDLGELSLEDSGDLVSDLSFEGAGKSQESVAETSNDADFSFASLDSLPEEIENGSDEIDSRIELDLDDLKVSDLGDLEIGGDLEMSDNGLDGTLVELDREAVSEEIESQGQLLDFSDADEDKLTDLSDLIRDEVESGGKEKTMILDDFSLDSPESAAGAGEFEFDDLPLRDSTPADEESLDLDDFNLDAYDSGETEKSSILDDLSMNDSSELEKSFDLSDISLDEYSSHPEGSSTSNGPLSDSGEIDLDLDAMSLDVEEYQKKPASDKDDFVLDLEDMDIDLDLNEPKK